MSAREFFYLVSSMREAQRRYFETRDRAIFRAARALENDVDREIKRVNWLLSQKEPSQPPQKPTEAFDEVY